MNESIQMLASRFRSECEADGVGIWQVVKAAGKGQTPEQVASECVAVVRSVLADGLVNIGQFEQGKFIPWPGNTDDQLDRLAAEILALEARVDIGDIGWLVLEPRA